MSESSRRRSYRLYDEWDGRASSLNELGLFISLAKRSVIPRAESAIGLLSDILSDWRRYTDSEFYTSDTPCEVFEAFDRHWVSMEDLQSLIDILNQDKYSVNDITDKHIIVLGKVNSALEYVVSGFISDIGGRD